MQNSSETRDRVEDWEQFFVEKSRRRSHKQRLERQRRRTTLTLSTGLVALAVIGAVVGLALLT